MSFHYAFSKGQTLLDYHRAMVSYLEDWQYRHLGWRIHKFSRVCPICLSIRSNRELVEMVENLYKTKSPSQGMIDSENMVKEEQQDLSDDAFDEEPEEDV